MKTNQNNPTEDANTAPVHSADCGRIRASVWENIANGSRRYKVTITRSFNQGGEWKRGRTFYSDELPALVEVAARAQRWIDWRQRQTQPQLPLATT